MKIDLESVGLPPIEQWKKSEHNPDSLFTRPTDVFWREWRKNRRQFDDCGIWLKKYKVWTVRINKHDADFFVA